MKRFTSILTLAAVAVASWSSSALACPSCVDPRDANANAFLGSTIMLSLIPLTFIISTVVWVIRREREAVAAQALDISSR